MRFALRFLFALIALASCGWADPPTTTHTPGLREAGPELIVIQDAEIVVRPGERLTDAMLVLKNRRIVQIGNDLDIPESAKVIRLAGKTIYPGLVDAFTDRSIDRIDADKAARYWNDKIRPADQIQNDYIADEAIGAKLRKQGITSYLVAPAGGILKGFGAVALNVDAPSSQSLLKANVTQHMRLTASRNSERTYPNSPMGAVALARQAFHDARWHAGAHRAATGDPSLDAPEHNLDLDALEKLQSSDNATPFVIDTSNELYFLRADRFAREFGLNLIVHGSGNEYRRLDAIRKTNRPVILPVDFPKPPNVGTIESAMEVSTESLMHWDIAPENPARMAEAGIEFAFCSQGLSDRAKYLSQVRIAVERGLSPEAALRALTVVPAKLLRVADQIGTLDPGKLASFVVCDGPLFADGTKVRETWVAGQRFEYGEKPKRHELAGTWKMRVGGARGVPQELVLKVEGKQKLSGEVSSKKDDDETKSVKLSGIVLNGSRLSMKFNTAPLGGRGVARITVLIDSQGARGSINMPGSSSAGTVVLTPDESEPDDKDTEKQDASKKESSSKKTTSGAKPSDKKEGSDRKEASEKEGDEKEDADERKDADEGKDAEKKRSGKSQPATYAVNFPLGAFGIDKPHDYSIAKIRRDPDCVAFVGATVWTCGPQGNLKNATVVIKDGKIVSVGHDVAIPKGARVVKLQGKHVTPGIIDCHSHFATDGGVNESGQAITAEVRIGDFIDCDDMNIYRQLAGGVTSSNILHGSANPIGGQNQVIKLRWGSIDEDLKFKGAPAGVKFALGENVKQSNWGDEFTTRYPQTRMGVEQIFRDEFHAAIAYRERMAEWNRTHEGLPPRRDLELDAIVEILEGKRWIHCHSYRQDEILALIRVLDEFEITIGTFQHILEGYKVADEMARHGAMGSAFADWWAYKFEVYDAIPFAGALMHRAGVVVSFNSDDRELARHLNHEAAKAMKYGGVRATEALKFVTLNPAKQLRIDNRVGSLEVGKDADLVVWSGKPMSTMTRCEQTWIDGIRYFDLMHDAWLRRQNMHIRDALIQKILASGESMRTDGKDNDDPANLWPREDHFCHGHDHGDGL